MCRGIGNDGQPKCVITQSEHEMGNHHARGNIIP
jgi:hypothetical protein